MDTDGCSLCDAFYVLVENIEIVKSSALIAVAAPEDDRLDARLATHSAGTMLPRPMLQRPPHGGFRIGDGTFVYGFGFPWVEQELPAVNHHCTQRADKALHPPVESLETPQSVLFPLQELFLVRA